MYTFLYIIFIEALNDKLRTIGSTLGEKKKKKKTTPRETVGRPAEHNFKCILMKLNAR